MMTKYNLYYTKIKLNMLPSIKTEAQYSKAKFYHSDGTGRDSYIL